MSVVNRRLEPGLALLLVLFAVFPCPRSPLSGSPPEEPRPAAARETPKSIRGEVRAIWVTRWDYRTEGDVRKLVAGCASLGLNRVMFQVRGTADAFYRSSLEPWSEELEAPAERGGDPGFDPLQTALAEAKVRGVELHAWVNMLPGWKGARPPRQKSHLVHTHPEWFMGDEKGKRRILDTRRYAMLNPCLPAVRDHLKSVLAEIAARYPVDGIQLDYIRFLEPEGSEREEAPRDPATLALFRSSNGTSSKDRAAAWDLFRRQSIDRLVAETSEAVRARRPGCRLSAAVIADRDHARSTLFQDGALWAARGWVDEVCPMDYQRQPGPFASCALAWARTCGAGKVVVGVGAHLLDGPRSLEKELRLLRDAPRDERPLGYCLFAYRRFFPENPGPAPLELQLRGVLRAWNHPPELTARAAAGK
jgi:uncharacterized lipoprotein YddW (UPF0748 family)